ncbi:MAG: SDR family NAD(P)-dependent oxidoreductase [Candidatus Hydrogenedentes bacterium]|nr:SDR family NAD(P)-dependent oxidoreductase [Candidatus Hydrogenedentota bacterium]
MKDFKGKVAVITGGASGIGRAMAERFAEEGMKIVIADVEAKALAQAESEMRADGAEVLAVQVDVSKPDEVDALAAKTVEAYGTAHLLCNNAGVGAGGPSWEISLEDWEWVLGVNLWGVIYGIRAFVPIMLKNGDSGHIVNTASMAGLTTTAGMAPYNVSKHGVVTLSEALHHELRQVGSQIGVSVLCPGWVDTKINQSDRNRPGGEVVEGDLNEDTKEFRAAVTEALKRGLAPRDVAELVLRSVIDDSFYILPHPHWKNMIEGRFQDILNNRHPTIVAPPDA